GGSPCIDLKHFGSSSSAEQEASPAAITNINGEHASRSTPVGRPAESSLSSHEPGKEDTHPPSASPEDPDTAKHGAEPETQVGASREGEEQLEEGAQHEEVRETKEEDQDDGMAGGEGEGTKGAAQQSSKTTDPLDVISEQSAGLRLREYLRKLLQEVLQAWPRPQ
ncbi:unnamed protein product, partial [Amoebophrya sp. A25]